MEKRQRPDLKVLQKLGYADVNEPIYTFDNPEVQYWMGFFEERVNDFDNERTIKISPELRQDQFMKQAEVAEVIIGVMLQDRSCWTFELDLRPFNESW